MNKDAFCDRAVAGIRFKPDRHAVREELMDHLNDRQDALMAAGIPIPEARERAVAAMGDPDALAKELAKIHRPWLGYFWQWSRTAAIWLGFFCAIFLLFVWEGKLIAQIPRYDPTYNENYFDAEYCVRLQPETGDGANGYHFSIPQAIYARQPTEDGEIYAWLHMTMKITTPLVWQPPANDVHRWFTAVDSEGNQYEDCWTWYRSSSFDGKYIVGNEMERGLFSTAYELWVENLDPDATWLELQFTRFDHHIRLRIDLPGGEAA